MVWIDLCAGLALLLAGGEALVRGAVALAARLGVSPMMIGLTLVGFGTSTPELVASLEAALAGAPGIAVGNVVGSNIANVLLILGVAAALHPVTADPSVLRRDGPVLLAATLAMTGAALWGGLGPLAGAAFLAGLAAYLVLVVRDERRSPPAPDAARGSAGPGPRPLRAALLATAGIAGVVIGADLLVAGAVGLARTLGVSEAAVGLTLVAVGTSLPELATSAAAAVRRQAEVALGNVVGSNIFNVLGIAGTVALVAPVPVPEEIARRDVWVMLAAALALVALVAIRGRIGRAAGLGLLAAYAAYLWLALGRG